MDLCPRTKELWAAYLAKCNEGNLSGLSHFAPACSVIGTGKHEIYRDLDQFTQAMNRTSRPGEIFYSIFGTSGAQNSR